MAIDDLPDAEQMCSCTCGDFDERGFCVACKLRVVGAPNHSPQCEHGQTIGVYCSRCVDVLREAELLRQALNPFPRQRFECYLQHAVRIVRWHARSSDFVQEVMVWPQLPQLCCEIGPMVVDFNGPNDLQLVAIVEPIKRGRPGELMPVAFVAVRTKGGG